MAPFYLSLFTCHPSPFTLHLFLVPVIIDAAAARTAATTTVLEIYVAGKAMKTICQRQTRFYSHYLYLRLHIFLFHIPFEIILFILFSHRNHGTYGRRPKGKSNHRKLIFYFFTFILLSRGNKGNSRNIHAAKTERSQNFFYFFHFSGTIILLNHDLSSVVDIDAALRRLAL